ncbi:unnamed protein product [Musa acuminata var. zebrina]
MARPPPLRSLFLHRTYSFYASNHLHPHWGTMAASTPTGLCITFLGFSAFYQFLVWKSTNSSKACTTHNSDMTPMICHIPQQYTDNPSQAVQSEPCENKINKKTHL